MATYKEIKGTLIPALAADPPTALAQGEMWYRSDSDVYKMGAKLAAWSAGGNLPGAQVGMASGGTRDAAWACSGQATAPAPTAPTATIFYNGTAWADQSAATTMPNSGYIGSTGTQAAAIMAGGNPGLPHPPGAGASEWGGSSWTAIPARPTDARYTGGFGTATTACMVGGATWGGITASANVDKWNGTSWSSETSMPVAKNLASGGSGIETLGLVVGGGQHPGIVFDTVDEYNGASWSAGAVYPGPVDSITQAGPSAAGYAFGGNFAPGGRTTETNMYDGEAWSSGATITTGRSAGGRAVTGGQTATALFGGTQPGNSNATEEYSDGDAIQEISTT